MIFTLLAQTPTPTTSPASGPTGGFGNLIILLPIFALLYFFMIRPQKRARQSQAQIMRSIEVGDEIETVAGMFGRVTRADDMTVFVEQEVRALQG